jgi:hypothetical protein
VSVITDFFNISWEQRRLSQGTATSHGTESIITSGSGFLHPVRDKSQLINESRFGKEFNLYIDEDISVNKADKIVINGEDYFVAGLSNYNDFVDDSDSHLRLRVYLK